MNSALVPVFVVGIIFLFLAFSVASICYVILKRAEVIRGHPKGRRNAEERQRRRDEDRLLQELHQALERFETRIENLETLATARRKPNEPQRPTNSF